MYTSNNIRLRQSTAMAVSNFKHAQAQLLGFVTDSTNHKFSSTAREVLLLSYSEMFDWIVFLEKAIIKTGPTVQSNLKVEAEKELDIVIKNIHLTVRNYPQYFEPNFVQTWLKVWEDEVSLLKNFLISKLREGNSAPVFVEVVSTVTQYMNHLLYTLHEIDFIRQIMESGSDSETPFIAIDLMDVELRKTFNTVSPTKRLKKYRALGLVSDSIVIKCYLSKDLLEGSSVLSALYEELLHSIRDENTKIIRVI